MIAPQTTTINSAPDESLISLKGKACPVGAPDSENFTALADLKEADVIEWAKANHPVEHMNEVIEKQIADQETPKNVEVDALPWVSE